MPVPLDVLQYLMRVLEELTAALDDRLIGLYAVGGVAFDDYRPGRSDVDLYAVVQDPLEIEAKREIADRCSHRALPCPARRLELVVVSAQAARRPGPAPRWELNLNTGAGDVDHVGLDPTREPSHWFVLDLAIAHEHGVALAGPAAHDVFEPAQLADVRAAQVDSIAWYLRNQMPADAVVAACRAWHLLATGAFTAKRDAVGWALARLGPEANS